MTPDQETDPILRYASVLQQLSPDSLNSLAACLADDVRFIDPFNDLYGRDNFIAVMAEMYEKLDGVRFEVLEQQSSGRSGYLFWRFHCLSRLTGKFSTEGCSRIKFDDQGLVKLHHDLWDASGLMQQFPVLGRVIRSIRNKAAFKV